MLKLRSEARFKEAATVYNRVFDIVLNMNIGKDVSEMLNNPTTFATDLNMIDNATNFFGAQANNNIFNPYANLS